MASLRRSPPPAHAQVPEFMARLLSLITAQIRCQRRLLACLALLLVSGCSQQQERDVISQFREGKPQEFLQTSVIFYRCNDPSQLQCEIVYNQ
ncbi:hypothetical protein [Pseudomonas sp. LB3P31]